MLDRFAMSKVPNDRSYVFFRILEQVYIGYWLVTYDLPGGGGGVGGGGGGVCDGEAAGARSGGLLVQAPVRVVSLSEQRVVQVRSGGGRPGRTVSILFILFCFWCCR